MASQSRQGHLSRLSHAQYEASLQAAGAEADGQARGAVARPGDERQELPPPIPLRHPAHTVPPQFKQSVSRREPSTVPPVHVYYLGAELVGTLGLDTRVGFLAMLGVVADVALEMAKNSDFQDQGQGLMEVQMRMLQQGVTRLMDGRALEICTDHGIFDLWTILHEAIATTNLVYARRVLRLVQCVRTDNRRKRTEAETQFVLSAAEIMRGFQEYEEPSGRNKFKAREWGERVNMNRQKITDCNKMIELTTKKEMLLALLENQADGNIDRAMDLVTDDGDDELAIKGSTPAGDI